MIIGNISNYKFGLPKYLDKRFDLAFNWIIENAKENIPSKYEINSEIYAKRVKYRTKERENCKFESHIKYIDLQYIVGGAEIIDCANIKNLIPVGDYDGKEDLQYYKNINVNYTKIYLSKLDFAIFFPFDCHRPQILNKYSDKIDKIVVKIKSSE